MLDDELKGLLRLMVVRAITEAETSEDLGACATVVVHLDDPDGDLATTIRSQLGDRIKFVLEQGHVGDATKEMPGIAAVLKALGGAR